MILSLVKEDPIKINAFGGNYLSDTVADTTLTILDFPSNIKAHIFVSWLHPFKDQKLIVIGDKAMAVFQDTMSNPDKLMIYNHKVEWDGELPIIEKARGEPLLYNVDLEPLKEECKAFIDYILKNKIPPSNAYEGLKVLKVLKEADNNLKSGGMNE